MSVILSAMSNHRPELVSYDIGQEILSYVDPQTLIRYERVCKQALDESKPCWAQRFEKIRASYLDKLQSRVKSCEKLLTEYGDEIVGLIASIQSSRAKNTTMSRQQKIERRNTLLHFEKTQSMVKAFYEQKVREIAGLDDSTAKYVTVFYEVVQHHLEDYKNKDLFAYIIAFAPCKEAAINEVNIRFNYINDAVPYQFNITSSIEHSPATCLKLSWNEYEETAWSLTYHNQSIVSFRVESSAVELKLQFESLFGMLGDCNWEYLQRRF